MKAKMTTLMIVAFLLTFALGTTTLAADGPSTTLNKAEIDIVSDGDIGYEVKQYITINNIEDIKNGSIEHTLSSINNIKIDNPEFSTEGGSLEVTTEESGTLDRYFVTPPTDASGEFTYSISYELALEQDQFTVPIFVPAVPSLGQENVVAINFTTAEGKIIQRNSFPILKKEEGNDVTSYLMNIPSHVNYIFGDKKSVFNLFNIVGWTSIAVLLLIVFIWIRSEVKQEKEVVK